MRTAIGALPPADQEKLTALLAPRPLHAGGGGHRCRRTHRRHLVPGRGHRPGLELTPQRQARGVG
ncbi:MAG: hypothetical protein R3A10_13655 [Caldilineaceae bacterium]